MSLKQHLIIIEAGKQQKNYWKDLLAFRELFFFLAWRDVKVRYKQTVLGIAWGVIRPLITLFVFSFIFGTMAGLPSNGIPYPLLVCAGILPWNFFSTAFSEAGASLISNSNLMTKIYFPRLIIPSSTALVCLLDFLIALALMFILMVYYGYALTLNVLLLPLLLLLVLICSLGAGFWIAALNVKYRDFRYVIPFIVQLGLYISPVGFRADLVPEKWRLLYYLNPMAGIIESFRWSLLGNIQPFYTTGFIVSVLVSFFLLFAGIKYFRKTERSFADVI